jgi:hypothetical protein
MHFEQMYIRNPSPAHFRQIARWSALSNFMSVFQPEHVMPVYSSGVGGCSLSCARVHSSVLLTLLLLPNATWSLVSDSSTCACSDTVGQS